MDKDKVLDKKRYEVVVGLQAGGCRKRLFTSHLMEGGDSVLSSSPQQSSQFQSCSGAVKPPQSLPSLLPHSLHQSPQDTGEPASLSNTSSVTKTAEDTKDCIA